MLLTIFVQQQDWLPACLPAPSSFHCFKKKRKKKQRTWKNDLSFIIFPILNCFEFIIWFVRHCFCWLSCAVILQQNYAKQLRLLCSLIHFIFCLDVPLTFMMLKSFMLGVLHNTLWKLKSLQWNYYTVSSGGFCDTVCVLLSFFFFGLWLKICHKTNA